MLKLAILVVARFRAVRDVDAEGCGRVSFFAVAIVVVAVRVQVGGCALGLDFEHFPHDDDFASPLRKLKKKKQQRHLSLAHPALSDT